MSEPKGSVLAVMLIAAGLSLSSPVLEAQAMTFGLNGHFWVQLGSSDLGKLQKLAYLRGIYDGLLFARAVDAEFYPHQTSWDSLSVALDSLYGDPANRPIPVALGLQVIGLKISTRSKSATDSLLKHFRCLAQVLVMTDSTESQRRRAQCPPRPRTP
jgi:hypothetical protein